MPLHKKTLDIISQLEESFLEAKSKKNDLSLLSKKTAATIAESEKLELKCMEIIQEIIDCLLELHATKSRECQLRFPDLLRKLAETQQLESLLHAFIRLSPPYKGSVDAWVPLFLSTKYPSILSAIIRKKCINEKSLEGYFLGSLPEMWKSSLLDIFLLSTIPQKPLKFWQYFSRQSSARAPELMSREQLLVKCIEADEIGALGELAVGQMIGLEDSSRKLLCEVINSQPATISLLKYVIGIRKGKDGIKLLRAVNTLLLRSLDLGEVNSSDISSNAIQVSVFISNLRTTFELKCSEICGVESDIDSDRLKLSEAYTNYASRISINNNAHLSIWSSEFGAISSARIQKLSAEDTDELVAGRIEILVALVRIELSKANDPEKMSQVRALLFNYGARPYGEPGERVEFNTANHQIVSGSPLPGDSVEIKSPGWKMKETILVKAEVIEANNANH